MEKDKVTDKGTDISISGVASLVIDHIHVENGGHFHLHGNDDAATTQRLVVLEGKLDQALALLQQDIAQEGADMATVKETLDRLQADVTAQTTVVDGVKTLLQQLAQQIRDNATDPAALEAIAAGIEKNSTDLSQAAIDNTPSA